jgi:hypothetical protein
MAPQMPPRFRRAHTAGCADVGKSSPTLDSKKFILLLNKVSKVNSVLAKASVLFWGRAEGKNTVSPWQTSIARGPSLDFRIRPILI